jgi:acetyltransferase-like isoleucine patch superfamily enzyme
MKIIYLLLALTPSFIHVRVRRLLGSKIDKNVKIQIGTFIFSKNIEIGTGTKIGPLSFIKSEELKIGQNTVIRPLAIISARIISIASDVQIAPLAVIRGDNTPRSKFSIGSHSRIFPFCWIDTGEGVTIGNHVGIGGHTLIFTHGVWSNYLEGGPVTFAPVVIEDEVWLPWRVFVMPGVTIGQKTIVGANSVVTKDVASSALVAGSPAKVLKENFMKTPSLENQYHLLDNIFKEFVKYRASNEITYTERNILFKNGMISSQSIDNKPGNVIFILNKNIAIEKGDLREYDNVSIIYHPDKIAFVHKQDENVLSFISFLRRYGIRLSVKIN